MSNVRVVDQGSDLLVQSSPEVTPEPAPSGSVRHRRDRWTWPAVFSGVVTLALLLLHFGFGFGLATVLTSSMKPTFGPGDAIVTRQTQLSDLRVGDIVIYHPPGQSIKIAHRIVSLTVKGGRTLATTRGDANPSDDKPFFIGNGGGPVVVRAFPHLGSVLGLANPERPQSRALLVGVLGMIFTAAAVRRALGPSSRCNCRRCFDARRSSSIAGTP